MSGIVGKNLGRGSGIVIATPVADESVDSDAYVDASVDTAHIGNDQVTYAKIQNVADDERILGRVSGADGVIEELTKAQVLTFANVEDGATADQSAAEIKTLLEDGIDSVHYVDGSIDNEHIADDAINSEHYAAASIDGEHLAVGKDGALSLDGSPDTDHTAVGPQTNTFAAGYTTTLMDLVYLGSSSKWLEADSDATGTSINLLGIALEVGDDTDAINVALPCSFVRDDTWNWTPGVPLYVSGTLGAITATKPTGSGDIVRTVGFAVHADMIYFNPSPDYITLAQE